GKIQSFTATGDLGFEPRLTDPESVVLPLHQSPRDSSVLDRVNQIVRISGFRCKPGRKGEPALGFGFGPGKLSPSLEPRRSAVPISGLATGPPAGVGGGSDRFWA